MSDVTTKAHLRAGLEAGRGYTDSAIGTLADIVAKAFEEAREPSAPTYNVPLTGWHKSGEQWYCDVSIPDMTSRTLVHVSVPGTSQAIATECGLSWICESRAGALRLYAERAPSKSFSIIVA